VIREIAKKLVPLVDSKKNSDLLELYMNHRIEELHKLLEQHEDMYNITKAQGAIQEVRRLKTLRDEVLARAEK
jgi:hypothetical protein|tara:strand:+ start:198 stop:416 length:219 start_codon:yes stop_codon:yes gene_type:complete